MANLQRALELSNKLPEREHAIGELEILEKLGMFYAVEYDPHALKTLKLLHRA